MFILWEIRLRKSGNTELFGGDDVGFESAFLI